MKAILKYFLLCKECKFLSNILMKSGKVKNKSSKTKYNRFGSSLLFKTFALNWRILKIFSVFLKLLGWLKRDFAQFLL